MVINPRSPHCPLGVIPHTKLRSANKDDVAYLVMHLALHTHRINCLPTRTIEVGDGESLRNTATLGLPKIELKFPHTPQKKAWPSRGYNNNNNVNHGDVCDFHAREDGETHPTSRTDLRRRRRRRSVCSRNQPTPTSTTTTKPDGSNSSTKLKTVWSLS